jgi:hypothetical protein
MQTAKELFTVGSEHLWPSIVQLQLKAALSKLRPNPVECLVR